MVLSFQRFAAVVATAGTALAAAAQSPERGETNWAVCSFEVTEGTHAARLLFEPFPISAEMDSFPAIRERFEEEVGVASVLPGYEPFRDVTIGSANVNTCEVFASKEEALDGFARQRAARGVRFTEVVQWAPADEVTGLAASAPATTPATDDRAGEAGETPALADAAAEGANAAAREAEELARREVEETARLNREAAEFAARQVAENEAARRKGEADRKAYEASLARVEREREAYEQAMEQNRREREEAQRQLLEYNAARQRHQLCVAGDRRACADIEAGRPALAAAGKPQEASTEQDATRCVSSPVVSPDPAFKGSTQAVVVNGCETAVDVRVCLLRTGGWNCAVTWGLEPQARWAHTSFESDGQVFWDARVSTSSRALARP